MNLSSKQLLWLEPKRNNLSEPVESPLEYAARIQQLLPNFPEQVLTQWFLEHDGVIGQHSGLDYPSLEFELAQFGSVELSHHCFEQHPIIVQYRDHFLSGVQSPRMNSLAQYIRENGTWPVPPLIFDNPDGRFVASWGLKYSTPYDLLEGHHRMAVLHALSRHKDGLHAVWLVKRCTAN